MLSILLACTLGVTLQPPEDPRWLTFAGTPDLPGSGRRIVLVAADQEYRSEQAMPMLAHLLAARHGFDTTVLFATNENGHVDPTQPIRWEDKSVTHNIEGLDQLAEADALVLFSRLITLPENQFQAFYDYFDSGKPILAIRTANHGFIGLDYRVGDKRINFGDQVLGGSFRGHHGRWHADSTRGYPVEANRDHPILRGVEDVWGPSDVYRTYPKGGSLPDSCTPLLMGQPLTGRQPTDGPNKKLIPLPVAWTNSWTGAAGKSARVFHSTMGSAKDFESTGVRRLYVNAVYWALGMEDAIRPDAPIEPVTAYAPRVSGFNYPKLGVRGEPVAAFDPRGADPFRTWTHSQTLCIVTNENGEPLPEDATIPEFALRIRLSSPRFPFTMAATDGSDLRFTDADGTQLSHHIKSWSDSDAEVWVRIPEIRGQQVQQFDMHWGRPGAEHTSDAAAVFAPTETSASRTQLQFLQAQPDSQLVQWLFEHGPAFRTTPEARDVAEGKRVHLKAGARGALRTEWLDGNKIVGRDTLQHWVHARDVPAEGAKTIRFRAVFPTETKTRDFVVRRK